MNNRLLLLGAFFILSWGTLHAQNGQPAQRRITLQEVIELARNESPASLRAETRKENRYWQYKAFKARFRPQLVLQSNVPQYTNSNIAVVQPDGSIVYRPINQNNTQLSLGLEQEIPWTGATLSVSSALNRFDDFIVDSENPTQYQADPLRVTINQPIFAFNQAKWDRQIQPMLFEESKRAYVEEVEQISIQAVRLYFDLLLAQISLRIAENNVANNDTVLRIAQGRFELGKIPENDLLQLELNLMNSQLAVSQAELDLETSALALKSFVGLDPDVPLDLAIPEPMTEFMVEQEKALDMALAHRQEALAFDRRRIEAEREVANARGNAGLNGNIYAQFGLTDSDQSLPGVFNQPTIQNIAQVGFRIPVLNWGRLKAVKEQAEANQQLTEYTVAQDRINFSQEIFTQVRQFEMLRERVEITLRSDEVAQRRYNIAKNRYLIGKISINDLSVALNEKDQAKRTYISSLRNLWEAYFNLRRLTLYDFQDDLSLYEED